MELGPGCEAGGSVALAVRLVVLWNLALAVRLVVL